MATQEQEMKLLLEKELLAAITKFEASTPYSLIEIDVRRLKKEGFDRAVTLSTPIKQ
jgi:hypothetical protein